MHPGIRPTGRGDRDAVTLVEVGQRTFQLSLDGPTARLGLEAGEIRQAAFQGDHCLDSAVCKHGRTPLLGQAAAEATVEDGPAEAAGAD